MSDEERLDHRMVEQLHGGAWQDIEVMVYPVAEEDHPCGLTFDVLERQQDDMGFGQGITGIEHIGDRLLGQFFDLESSFAEMLDHEMTGPVLSLPETFWVFS